MITRSSAHPRAGMATIMNTKPFATSQPSPICSPPLKAQMSGFKINDINFSQCQSTDDPIAIVVQSDKLFVSIEKLSISFLIKFDDIRDIKVTGRGLESLCIDLVAAPEISLIQSPVFSPSGFTSQLMIFRELLEVSSWPGTMEVHNVSYKYTSFQNKSEVKHELCLYFLTNSMSGSNAWRYVYIIVRKAPV